jgi:hypothetical protein
MHRACEALDSSSVSSDWRFQVTATEVREVYQDIAEDVQALIELSGASRSTYAPSILAMHADRLKRGFLALQKVLRAKG